MIRWKTFHEHFAAQYASIKNTLLEPKSTECGPYLRTTGAPHQAPWVLDWAVIFADNNYVRVSESYRRCGHPYAGAGESHHLSYHYGQAHSEREDRGFPRKTKVPEALIRIDIDRMGPH